MAHVLDLPDEVFKYKIFPFLSLVDLVECSMSCSELKVLVESILFEMNVNDEYSLRKFFEKRPCFHLLLRLHGLKTFHINKKSREDIFFQAVKSNNFPLVRLFDERLRFDVNIEKHKALAQSCRLGHTKTVKILLPRVRQKDIDTIGYMNMMISCEFGYREIVKMLIDYGVSPSKSSQMPLRVSLEYDQKEVVLLLLEYEVVKISELELYFFHKLFSGGLCRMIELIFEHQPLPTHNFLRLFRLALVNGKKKLLNQLIVKGMKWIQVHKCQMKVIDLAIEYRDITIINTILEEPGFCVDPYQAKRLKKLAARVGNVQLIKSVLERCRSLQSKPEILSLLFEGCRFGKMEITKYVLETFTKLIDPSFEGGKVMFEACKNGHIQIVRVLVESKIGFAVGTADLEISVENGSGEELLKFLMDESRGREMMIGGRHVIQNSNIFNICIEGDRHEVLRIIMEIEKFTKREINEGINTALELGNERIIQILQSYL